MLKPLGKGIYMSKLFLTSYLAGTKNLVKEFFKDVPEKEITFVPTASNTEDYKGYVDEAKQAFLELGFSINILDISKTEKQKIENILKDTKILYISGGNTFYLLQELKRKKILDTIKNKISNGCCNALAGIYRQQKLRIAYL